MNRFTPPWTGRGAIPTPLEKRSTQPRVTLQELEEQCGLPPGSALTKLASMRVKVEGDWCGRPSVSLPDAARVFTKVVGDIEVDSQKWASYQGYLASREERREQAASAAAHEARKGVAGSPQQQSRGSAAAAEARQRFEEQEPLVPFEEYRVGGESQ